MDNNFDDLSNGYNGFEPQKPFTDKSNQYNNAPNDKSSWQSESAQNTPNDSLHEKQSAAPADNLGAQPPYYEENNANSYNSNTNSGGSAQNDYSNHIYNNGFEPNYNNNYSNSQNIPYGKSQYGEPQRGYAQPPANNFTNSNGQIPYAPYAQNAQPNPPKKRMGGGLIALIVVLCVLLSSSLTGLGVYIACNSGNNTNSNNNSSGFYFNSPSPTLPRAEETTPEGKHDESDYSDEVNKDFGGISLNGKPKDTSNSKYNSQYAYDMVSDSVVGVVCYKNEITTVEKCSSQGSGIVITSDGYVVTNSHVIGNSKTAYLIQVITADGKTYNAGVVGFDSRTDIAVLKMDDAKNLKAAAFGNSDDIELGEDIIAVGNPGGLDYQNSITKGIVSAVNRRLSSSSLIKYIQTDAAINPGNSGGPIVNLYGQVIGIATSKIVSEKYEGMGFAIPSATAKDIINDLIKQGYISGRVKIGITGIAIDSATASSSNVPQGIYVQEILLGGPCDGTSLKTEDIITEADGEAVTSFADIYEILGNHKTGDKIKLKYYRMSDGSEGTVEVTLQEDK